MILWAYLPYSEHLVQVLIVGRLKKKLILCSVLHVTVRANYNYLFVPPVGLLLVVALVKLSH